MKRLFRKWIFLVLLLAFLLTFAVSFAVNTRQARLASLAMIHLKLSDAAAQLDDADDNLARVTELSNESVLLKAQLFAAAVAANRSFRQDKPALGKLCAELDLDELYVFSGENRVIAAWPEERGKLARELDLPSPGEVGVAGALSLQYAAAARTDAPGMVVVGDKPEHLLAARKIADIHNFSESFRIGLNGGVVIARGDTLVCDGMLDLPELPETRLASMGFPARLPKAGEVLRVKLLGTDYLGTIMNHGEYSIIGLLPESEVFHRRNLAQSVLVIVYLLLFTLIFFLIAFLIDRIVLSGIHKVCRSLQRITDGDLSEIVDVHTCREFDVLSDGINATVSALKNAIAEAARRLDNELDLARSIQCSALPRVFPPFPERSEFDLCASMTPAREVGGDFYDFFLVDDDHLAFLVADVSEKGIPAALFMMSGKTWLKGLTLAGLPPERVFNEANRMLSVDNDAGMFITVFFGCLELSTGKLTCINAGHNPPLLKRAQGGYEYLKLAPDFLLGPLPGVSYTAHHLQLQPGDRLFLYTDGVTEALDSGQREFGTGRLAAALNGKAELPPPATLEAVSAALAGFTGETAQYDDITMLSLVYHGKQELTLPARPELLPELQEFLEMNCSRLGLKPTSKTVTDLLIVGEEIFINIASYAYGEREGEAKVTFAYLPESRLIRLRFEDSGTPYDPLQAPEPEFGSMKIGGMGIHITRTLSSELKYERTATHNIFTAAIPAGEAQ